MQSLEAACEEAEKILEKVKSCSLPLSRPQDFQTTLPNFDIDGRYSFSIFNKLKDLYYEECIQNLQNKNSRFKIDSYLLEKLVARERLNTLILSLLPEKNEYSISIRLGSIGDDGNMGCNIEKSPYTSNEESLIRLQWQLDDEFLRHINNEELPCMLTDILENEYPELFYSGCVIVEVRDYQQVNSQLLCKAHHVLLKPSSQTILADVNSIVDKADNDWSDQQKLFLESELINTTNSTLCLDPRPTVCVLNNKLHHQRHLLNTSELRKCAHRFAKIPGKRKLDAQTVSPGLELYDFIVKKRTRFTENLPKAPRMVLPAPSFDTNKPLDLVPEKVETSKFQICSGFKDTANFMPVVREEITLETERLCVQNPPKLFIKLSILQRPANFEHLGELYYDMDYQEGRKQGTTSRFTLGSKSYVQKLTLQFTELERKETYNPIKITKYVPGERPKQFSLSGYKIRDIAPDHVQAVQEQQILADSNTLINGNAGTPVTFVQQPVQTPARNSGQPVPLLQAQLQANSQSKLESRHTRNPDINAFVAGFMNNVQKMESETASKPTASTSSANNSMLLSQLNTLPVNNVHSATSAAVANEIINNIQVDCGITGQQTLNQKVLGRKMAITNTPRMLNQLNQCSNVITVNSRNAVVTVPQQMRLSPLTSQLAAPPVNVFIATSNSAHVQQGQTVTLAQAQPTRLIRKASNCDGAATSSSLSALLVNTPSADHPMPGSNNTSSFFERLTAASATPQLPGDANCAKNNPVSPQSQQTLNVLNLTPFQGTRNNISGIQNVQVQLPRLSSPLNSVVSSTNLQQHSTSLIFSVAVTTSVTTCTSPNQQLNNIATSSLGSNASAVITNNTTSGSTSPGLPLSFAQLTASEVKGLTQQGLRISNPSTVSAALAQSTNKTVQFSALQRNSQITSVKQQLTRGLLPNQRLTNTAIKLATSNATTAQVTNATALSGSGLNIASNSIVTLSPQQQQQLQLTFQKQQYQQYHQQLQSCLSQQQQKAMSAAAVATKHHRRSNAADPNQ